MHLRHLSAIAALPFTVTVIVPAIILYQTGTLNPGWSMASPLNLGPVLLGGMLIALGFALMVQTISLFATTGEGTLAPWDPTRKLVVHGIYRHVRNPMISGVFAILLGEVSMIGSAPILYWSIGFLLINVIYMPLVEEPGLERRFGDAYIQYRKNVPRWIPRLKPWEMRERDG